MTDDIRPALTADEWAEIAYWKQRVEFAGSTYFDNHDSADTDATIAHRMAAAALYGQPFGFTREDVALLEDSGFTGPLVESGDVDGLMRLRSLTARISALLPPE